jgi:regulator of cell morphogenesis and NO signaling
MPVNPSKTVRELAAELPYATRIFENLGIDYCCGGQRPLSEACSHSQVSVDTVIEQLEVAESAVEDSREASHTNWTRESLPALINQILKRHHVYIREEGPRLQKLFAKVATKHGEKHPEILRARELFEGLLAELHVHLMKEEQILFPYVLRMEESQLSGEPVPPSCFGTVQNPIAMMMSEHDGAGEALRQIRKATGNLEAPDDACISFQSLYRDLRAFEADLHQHIHLENNILFPRALAMERADC